MYLQNTTQKTTDWATWTSLTSGSELRCSGREYSPRVNSGAPERKAVQEWTHVHLKGKQPGSELGYSGRESSSGVNSVTPEGKAVREWTQVLLKGKQSGSELMYSWRESSPGVNSCTPEGKAVPAPLVLFLGI